MEKCPKPIPPPPPALNVPSALGPTWKGPFEIVDAVPQAEWEYDHLCTYLGDAEEMMARLELLSKGRQDSEASTVVPAVPSVTATAVER